MPGCSRSQQFLDPRVFGRKLRQLQASAAAARQVTSLLHKIHTQRIKGWEPVLEVAKAGSPRSRAILQRKQISHVQLHGVPQRGELAVGSPDVTQASPTGCSIVSGGLGHEANAAARRQNSAEVFAVVINVHFRVPRPGGDGEPSARQPRHRRHIKILPHTGGQPVRGGQVCPKRRGNELCAMRPVHETTPCARKKNSGIVRLPRDLQLQLDFSRRQ